MTKKSSLSQYLGCSIEEFKKHLESYWEPGMTWDNYGNGLEKWNMDHTLPLASATSAEEMHKLCHYTNIRPMWSIPNSTKNDKTPEEWAIYQSQNPSTN
jgi:hypothetical protein